MTVVIATLAIHHCKLCADEGDLHQYYFILKSFIMQTAYSHPHTARPYTGPGLTSSEIAWGVTLLLAYLGLPFLRELLVWVLFKVYETFIMYLH